MAVDERRQITAFVEKPADPPTIPGRPDTALASMGIYVFDTDFLLDELARDAADPDSAHDFGHDLLPRLVAQGQLHAHRFEDSCVNIVEGRPYWRDVGTVDAYWAANMDLTHVVPELNLYDDAWPVLSQQRQLPPAKFVLEDGGRLGVAINSLVAGGCIISGATVRRSILFSKVRLAEDSLIEDSLLLPNVEAGARVQLRRVIVDKHCVLPDGFSAGLDPAADRQRGFHVTPGGVTLVTPEMIGQAGRVG
jgi:glucose-1-phosphate adenylyltransferase